MSIFKKSLEYLFGKDQMKEYPNQKIEVVVTQPEINCINNKIIYNVSNQTVIVVTCDGDKFEGSNVQKEQVDKLRTSSKEEIINILTPTVCTEIKEIEVKEQELVSKFLGVFNNSEDFQVLNDQVYFKSVKNIAIPNIIVARFIELLQNIESNKNSVIDLFNYNGTKVLEEQYNSLKMFTFWLLLNPIKAAREDALDFIKKNQIPITSNGMLVTFRKVVSKGAKNKELVKFISESFFKTKKNKKSPKNYEIYDDNSFVLVQKDKKHDFNNYKGNLADLYSNLTNLEENIFTDNHTRSKSIKIGEVYKEDEDKIDLDNTKDCSAGLHSGSLSFGSFNSFGDTGVICLVNPMKIRSVPINDCSKMRSSELFPIAIIDFEDYKNFVETNEVSKFSEIYCNESIEFLQEALKNKQFDKFTCQDNLFEMNPKEIINVIETLKKRVISI